MLPSPQWMGRPEKHSRRAVIDAVLYVVRTGCPWRYLPVDFPPWQTVYAHFTRLNRRGVTERIRTELREQIRVAHGRDHDAGKKINSRKRFIVTDALGLLVTVWVLAASWQDRDGAKGAPLATYAATPIRHVFADTGFAGRLVDRARDLLRTTVEIVREPADQRGFVVHPRRWVVERTLA